MPIVLSISHANERIWAAGPEGLFSWEGDSLQAVPQPMQRPTCVLALDTLLLIGGDPHGIAFSTDEGMNWQAAWTDQINAPALVLAKDPDVTNSGVILAGTEGGGILRSTDRGRAWKPCNYGLKNYTVLAIAWAPPTPTAQWPPRAFVFAGTEEGIYHSPNSGRAWKRSRCPQGAYQTVAVSPAYHEDGIVLAGTEAEGLYRSEDGGHTFEQVDDAPEQINSLLALPGGWLLSDWDRLYWSVDGNSWQAVPDSTPALTLAKTDNGILTGNQENLTGVNVPQIGSATKATPKK